MIPYMYDYINTAESAINPTGVTVNSGIKRYFERYLMQKIMSVFDWRLPDEWNKDFFQYVLYSFGYIAVIDTDKYGVIPQNCTLGGFGLYYEPTKAIITNPALPGLHEKRIGINCEIIKMQPDYGGVTDIINVYSTLMACVYEGISTNIFNSRLAYVFAFDNPAQEATFKKMFDNISMGHPAVFAHKSLFDDEGNPRWITFSNKLKENYIAGEMLEDLANIENRFYTAIGIRNANTEKKERLIVDEVNANNEQTEALVKVWLDTMNDGCKRVNSMFGTNLSVRIKDDAEGAVMDNVY